MKESFQKFLNFFFLSFLLLFMNCLSEFNPQFSEAGKLDLSSYPCDELSTYRLNGKWLFQWMESESFDRSRAVPISIPGTWSSSFPSKGYGVFHIEITPPKNCKDLGLKLINIPNSYRLHINNEKVLEIGKFGTDIQSTTPYYANRVYNFHNDSDREIHIDIYLSNFILNQPGILSSIHFGSQTAIYRYSSFTNFIQFSTIGYLTIIGFYSFLFFILKRNYLSALYFGIFCFMISGRELFTSEKIFEILIPNLSFTFYYFWETIFTILAVIAFLLYIRHLFLLEVYKIIYRGLLSFHYLLLIASLSFSLKILPLVNLALRYSIIVSSLFVLIVSIISLLNKKQGAGSFLLSLIFFSTCMFLEILNIMYSSFLFHFMYFGFFFLTITQIFILSNRFILALNTSENILKKEERVNQIKDEFLSNLSHELKTPLSLIFAYSEILSENTQDDPENFSLSRDLIYQASLLNDLINDLMFVTDLESKFEIYPDEINLKDLTEEAILYLHEISKEKKVTVFNRIPNVIRLHADRSLVLKTLLILIKNSILYNKENGIVEIFAIENLDNIRINIKDNGIGIHKDFHSKVFEKFFRVDSSINYETSGVGLGLFLAKKIMELHNGEIFLYSFLNSGTSIDLVFPIKLINTGNDK